MADEAKNWIPILSGSAWALGLDVPAELIGHAANEVLASIDPELAKRFGDDDILVAGWPYTLEAAAAAAAQPPSATKTQRQNDYN